MKALIQLEKGRALSSKEAITDTLSASVGLEDYQMPQRVSHTHQVVDIGCSEVHARVLRVETGSSNLELGQLVGQVVAGGLVVVGVTGGSQAVGTHDLGLGDDVEGRVGGVVVAKETLAELAGRVDDPSVATGEEGHDCLAVPKVAVAGLVLVAMVVSIQQTGVGTAGGLGIVIALVGDVVGPVVKEGQVTLVFGGVDAVDLG